MKPHSSRDAWSAGYRRKQHANFDRARYLARKGWSDVQIALELNLPEINIAVMTRDVREAQERRR